MANNWSPSGVPSPSSYVNIGAPGAGGTTITLDGLSNQGTVGSVPVTQTQPYYNVLNFTGNAFSGSTGYTINEGTGTSPLGYASYAIQTSFSGKGITETLNVPLIGGGNGTIKNYIALGNYTPVTSNAVLSNVIGDNSGNTLSVTGPISYTDSGTSTAYYLALQGMGNGNVSGPITLASGTAKLNLFVNTSATWTLSNSTGAANTYGAGGTTQIRNGGALVLDYSGSVYNAATENPLIGTTSITLGATNGSGGGTLKVVSNGTNTNTAQKSINVGALTISQGADRLILTGNSSTQTKVTFGAVGYTRATGGTLDITANTASGDTGGFYMGANPANSSNILGGWATVNGGADFASFNSTSGKIESLTQNASENSGTVAAHVNDTWATGNNTDVVTNNLTQTGKTTNSLRFDSSAATTLNLSGTNTLTSGGLLVTSNIGGNVVNITGGILQVGSSNELILNQYDTANGAALAIGSQINLTSGQALTISGGGKVILSGANSLIGTTTIYLNQGTLQLGSSTALGSATSANKNALVMGGQSTLDLHGNSLAVFSLNDDSATPLGAAYASPGATNSGSVMAKAGLADNITNSVAGTIATLSIGVAGQNSGTMYFTGGLTEASGAILGLSLAGTQTFNLGGHTAYNGGLSGNGLITGQIYTNYNLITGAVNIGAGSVLEQNGFTMLLTQGALIDNGTFSLDVGGGEAGANYLSGTGTVNVALLGVGSAGTVADAFNGTLTGNILNLNGNGTLTVANAQSGASYDLTGTATLSTPGQTVATTNNIVSGNSTLKLTGTTGAVMSSGISLTGGTIAIAPSGSGSAVTVTSANTAAFVLNADGGGTLQLSAGGNTSVTLSLGNGIAEGTQSATQSGAFVRHSTGATLVIAAADGLANLGLGTAKDKLIFNTTSGTAPNASSQANGIFTPWMVGQDSDANKSGAFLAYSGTGLTSDTGVVVVTPGNINNLNASTGTTVARVTNTQTLTAAKSVYGLEIDNNATSDTGGTLTGVDIAGTGSSGAVALGGFGLTITQNGGLILNGGSIAGTGTSSVTLTNGGNIYTSLAGGKIDAAGGLNVTAGNLSIFGPGALVIGSNTATALTMVAGNSIYINSGALDLAGGVSALPTNVNLALRGGVFESNGTFTEALGTGNGQVSWAVPGSAVASAGGGFAAQGGALNVNIGGGTPLIWGAAASGGNLAKTLTNVNGTAFLGEYGNLMFGATNATNIVNFQNAINLGLSATNPVYWRTVQVTANSNDGSDPFASADAAVLSGVISSGVNGDLYAYHGLAVAGNGVLVLTGTNTYTGATSIAAGSSLLINSDSNLGTAPTAAYALNTTPGISGGAVTSGAVVISGGGTLGIYGAQGVGGVGTYATTPTAVTLSSNRQILLASGATGATAANINVYTGTTATFGGLIGDYINEVGSLNKNGAGSLILTNSNVYSGSTSVSAGKLYVNNAGGASYAAPTSSANRTITPTNSTGSGTGSGSVVVNSGGTLAGSGTILSTSGGVTVKTGGTLSSGAIQTGTTAGTGLTINNSTAHLTNALTVQTGASLTFALGSTTDGSGSNTFTNPNTNSTFLSLTGSTADLIFATPTANGVNNINLVDLTAGSPTLTLSLRHNNPYLLIQTELGNNADFANLLTSGGLGQNGYVLGVSDGSSFLATFKLTMYDTSGLDITTSGDYGGLQLYLSNGDLVVVPEPGTGALLLGGMASLVVIQRRRNKS